jgi:formylmethanofuran dehydrogenase subunit E
VVETDRCLPDVIEMVIGCRLGNRTLKLRDWGKMAASFLDITRNRAVRIAALESVEAEAHRSFKDIPRDEALTKAYTVLADEILFKWQPAVLKFSPQDFPGYRSKRVLCERCGEGIGFGREARKDGLTLCRACAGEAYWLSVGTK